MTGVLRAGIALLGMTVLAWSPADAFAQQTPVPNRRAATPIADAITRYAADYNLPQSQLGSGFPKDPPLCRSTRRCVVRGALVGAAIGGLFGTLVGYQSEGSPDQVHAEMFKFGFTFGGLGAAAGAFIGMVLANP